MNLTNPEPRRRPVIPQVRQQVSDRFHLPGQDEVRCDFSQGRQHEPPLRGARVGQGQPGSRADLAAKGEEVQIERAWLIEHLSGPAPELTFQGLKPIQQRFRRLVGLRYQRHDRVHEPRRSGWAIDRRRLPEG